jgi:repressor LexA
MSLRNGVIAINIGEIINRRRKELSLTLEEIGNAVGVSKSTVKKWEDGYISNMKRDKIAELSKILKINPVVLITGEYSFEETIPYTPKDMIPIPVIGRVAAGYNCLAETNIEYYELVNNELINDGYDYVYLKVKGDSMTPLILEDDLVLVRIQSDVNNGDYAVVIVDEEDGLVKKIERGDDYITLLSENPYYPPRKFERNDMNRIRIYGKVIESKRKF